MCDDERERWSWLRSSLDSSLDSNNINAIGLYNCGTVVGVWNVTGGGDLSEMFGKEREGDVRCVVPK
eukprot:3390300-Amphidinium_carterae.2